MKLLGFKQAYIFFMAKYCMKYFLTTVMNSKIYFFFFMWTLIVSKSFRHHQGDILTK